LILRNNTRDFINFFFELLHAAKQGLKVKKIVDSQKNLFYSSRYKWDTNNSTSNSFSQYQSTTSNNKIEGFNETKRNEDPKIKKKKNLNISIKVLTKQDLVDIIHETSNSFSNVKLPKELFEKMVDHNIQNFKNQLEGVIMSNTEDQQHKHEIERIYYEIQKDRNYFEMTNITFYYFFKMNSLFANWGIFDYQTFQTRCKSMMS
jgi:hypothetical protein